MSGTGVSDSRSGSLPLFPRLNIGQAVRPLNDLFANAAVLTGNAGSAAASNVDASKEAGEPNHAGNIGGKSVWWQWTAPASGQVSLNTHGSGFNTLLAVYTGPAISSLALVAANNDDGSGAGASGLLFQSQGGTVYQIAVDGADGVSGAATLNWALNTTAAADLAVQISATPVTPLVGSLVTYTVTVRNNGPQIATNVKIVDVLPPTLTFVSGSGGCVLADATVTCALKRLAAGGVATVQIVVTVTAAGPIADQIGATSDLPDGSGGNNAATVTITASPVSATVPTLPLWAVLALGAALIGSAIRFGRMAG
jgi:uncharacterized repeat protein (TIGR01451 family)